jgi:hypothetical protein
MAKKIIVQLVRNSSLGESTREFDLDSVTLGRRPECEIVFDAQKDPLVSGLHATVRREGEFVTIEDNGSSNGTFLNGVRIAGRKRVNVSDRVTLGQAGPELMFRLFDPVAPSVVATVPAMQPARSPIPSASSSAATIPAQHAQAASSPPRPPSLASQGKMKDGIGMNTLMGVLTNERGKERKKVLGIVAAILVPLCAGVAVLMYLSPWKVRTETRTEVKHTEVVRGSDWPAIYEKVAPSVYVVLIRSEKDGKVLFNGAGTAWSVAPGKLATNSHVAEQFFDLQQGQTLVARRIDTTQDLRIPSVKLHPGYATFAQLDARYWAFNPQEGKMGGYIPACDVALMDIDPADVSKQAPPLTLASAEEIAAMKAGTEVAAVGFPMEGLNQSGFSLDKPDPQRRNGAITRLTDNFLNPMEPAKAMLISHTVGSAGGASGSPLINSAGHVVGLHSAGDVLGKTSSGRIMVQGFSYAQNVQFLRDMLDNQADARTKVYAAEWTTRMAEQASRGVDDHGRMMRAMLSNIVGGMNLQIDMEKIRDERDYVDEVFNIKPNTARDIDIQFEQGLNYVCVIAKDPLAEIEVSLEGVSEKPMRLNEAEERGQKIRRYFSANLLPFDRGGSGTIRVRVNTTPSGQPVAVYVFSKRIPVVK